MKAVNAWKIFLQAKGKRTFLPPSTPTSSLSLPHTREASETEYSTTAYATSWISEGNKPTAPLGATTCLTRIAFCCHFFNRENVSSHFNLQIETKPKKSKTGTQINCKLNEYNTIIAIDLLHLLNTYLVRICSKLIYNIYIFIWWLCNTMKERKINVRIASFLLIIQYFALYCNISRKTNIVCNDFSKVMLLLIDEFIR